jgi:hypothetical protein
MSNSQVIKCSLLAISVSLFFTLSCKKSDDATGPGPTSDDLFPLKVGNYALYNEWDLDANNAKVAGSDHRYSTTVAFQTTKLGLSAYALVDSTFLPTGALETVDTAYVRKESNGDLQLFLDLSELIDLPLPLPSFWANYVKPSAGVGSPYIILDTTITQPLTMHITLTGQIQGQENVTVPEGSYTNVYKSKTSIAVIPLGVVDRYLWLAPGVGPIKEQQPSTVTALGAVGGFQNELVYKRLL